MREIVSDCSNPKLSGIIEMQWVNYSRELSSTGYIEILKDPYLTLYSTTIPSPNINGVVLAQLLLDKIEMQIDEVKEYFKSRGLPWTWHIEPLTRPLELGNILRNMDLPVSMR